MSPATAPGSQADSCCTRSPTSSQRNWRWVFGRRMPGRSPASVSTWKPLQMPSTGPPAAASSRTAAIAGESAASAPGRR